MCVPVILHRWRAQCVGGAVNIFDVFRIEELEELPDDPREAFTLFVSRAQEALSSQVAQALEEDPDNGWRTADEHRHDFMSMIIAAGKRFGIGEFRSRDVPERANWGYDQYREFSSELNHYLTQVVLDNSIRGRRESVELPTKSKDRIRQHIHALKKLIDDATLDPEKKSSMLAKLERFEQELDKRRVSFSAMGLLAITLISAPGGIWQSAEIANKLIHDVFQEVNEVKVADDARRLAAPNPEPAQISPPRRKFAGPKGNSPAFETGGIDDDLPF